MIIVVITVSHIWMISKQKRAMIYQWNREKYKVMKLKEKNDVIKRRKEQ